MSELEDEIKEFKEDLSDIDKLFYDTALSTSKLNKGLSSTQRILDGDQWKILSRITSGGMFWRIQNRVRAVIETANMLTSMSARKAKREAENMRESAKLAKQYEKLIKIQEFFEKGSPIDDEMKNKIQETDVYYSNLLGFYKEGLSQEEATQKAMAKTLRMIQKKFEKEGVLSKFKEQAGKKELKRNSLLLKSLTGGSTSLIEMFKKITGIDTLSLPKPSDVSSRVGSAFDKSYKNREDILGEIFKGKATTKPFSAAKALGRGFTPYEKKMWELSRKIRKEGRLRDKIRFKLNKGIYNIVQDSNRVAKFMAKRLMFLATTLLSVVVLLVGVAAGILLLKTVFENYSAELIAGFQGLIAVVMVGVEMIMSGFGNVLEGLITLKDGFFQIINGDLLGGIQTIVTGAATIFWGAIQILGGVIVAAFGGVIGFLAGLISEAFRQAGNNFVEAIGRIMASLGGLIAGILLIAGTVALVLGAAVATPLLIAAAIAGAVYLIGQFLVDNAEAIMAKLIAVKDGIVDAFNAAIDFIVDGINSYINQVITNIEMVQSGLTFVKDEIVSLITTVTNVIGALSTTIYNELYNLGTTISNTLTNVKDGLISTLNSIITKLADLPSSIATAIKNALDVKFFASGGVVNSPFQVVGEEGPELVKLPRGSRVFSNNQSRSMLSGSTNNITVQVSGRVGASDSEIRDIARKVAKEINTQMNRTSSTVVRI